MQLPPQNLVVMPGRFAICELAATADIPLWATSAAFVQITRTPGELSIVCDDAVVPAGIKAERERRFIRVQGPISFDTVGVVAGLALPLAEARISIVVVASSVTDYIVVADGDLERAIAILRAAGHTLTNE